MFCILGRTLAMVVRPVRIACPTPRGRCTWLTRGCALGFFTIFVRTISMSGTAFFDLEGEAAVKSTTSVQSSPEAWEEESTVDTPAVSKTASRSARARERERESRDGDLTFLPCPCLLSFACVVPLLTCLLFRWPASRSLPRSSPPDAFSSKASARRPVSRWAHSLTPSSNGRETNARALPYATQRKKREGEGALAKSR